MGNFSEKKLTRRQFIKGAATAVALPHLLSNRPLFLWFPCPCR